MRFSYSLIIFTAAVASAAPVADAEADPWCLIPRQGCWKNKRAPDAAPEAAPAPAAVAEPEPWCLIPRQGCWKVKRVAEAFAEALAADGPLEARSAGSPAASAARRNLDELALVIALSEALGKAPEDLYSEFDLTKFLGGPDDGNATETKRDLEEDKRWCLIPRQGCWKAKRVAEAVINTIGDINEARSAPFNPEARVKRDPEPWCLIPRQGCWKREAEADAKAEAACNSPSGACTKAKRDLQAIYSVARGILDA